MIKLEKVNRFFNKGRKNEIHAINETTLDLGEKGLVALLGPSGCGKTTLLNAMGGLDKVQSGDIYINGERITRRRAGTVDRIRGLNIGYIFQDYKLIDSATVYENVAVALRLTGMKNEKEIREKVDYVLNAVNMYRYRNRKADMLSGGERQRVGIARALVKNSRIIIADEPTGNLDSANSVEIMRIIKAISRDRLVVLVTHEVELARFFASRIIELKDGAVVADYDNTHDEGLDYRIDSTLYLRDFEKHAQMRDDGVNVDFYGEAGDSPHVTLAVRNGNLYVCAEGYRVEPAGDGAAVKFVDGHYSRVEKPDADDYDFTLPPSTHKEKYSSVTGFFKSVGQGFKTVAAYSVPKKMLMIGFLMAGIFATFAFSGVAGVFSLEDSEFVLHNKNSLLSNRTGISLEAYDKYSAADGVEYILPTQSSVVFCMPFNDYYQTSGESVDFAACLGDVGKLSEGDIVAGRLPQNSREVVLDKMLVDSALRTDMRAECAGYYTASQVVGKLLTFANELPFDLRIVGIADCSQPTAYMAPELFNEIVYYNYRTGNDMTVNGSPLEDASAVKDSVAVKAGRMPAADGEAAVPYAMREEMPLNRQVKEVKLCGKDMTVVGYYEPTEKVSGYLVTQRALLELSLQRGDGLTVLTSDSKIVAESLRAMGLRAVDAYEQDRENYILQQKGMLTAAFAMEILVLLVSLIEILLMVRASFMSRIKEVGTLRAIGVKKSDIYRIFSGEIFAVTTVGCLPGVAIMAYAMYHICRISDASALFVMNPAVVLAAVALLYVFNALVGLIPVFVTMRKTPAAILSRTDVE